MKPGRGVQNYKCGKILGEARTLKHLEIFIYFRYCCKAYICLASGIRKKDF